MESLLTKDNQHAPIYLASPYMHENPRVIEYRYKDAVEMAALITRQELTVFSPIAHSHVLAQQHDLPGHFGFWEQFDRCFLRNSQELWVLCLHGWLKSKGVNAEIVITQELERPVHYVEFEPRDERGYRFVSREYAEMLSIG